MDVPENMKAELARWNSGAGIDLETWVSCHGRLALAIGYAPIFWPEFECVDEYVLRKGWHPEARRGFERRPGATRQSTEWVLNHIHLVSLHALPDPDISSDKLIALGNVLAEIHRVKLAWEFPDRPCEVEFHIPDNRDDLVEYQLSFWQVGDPSEGPDRS